MPTLMPSPVIDIKSENKINQLEKEVKIVREQSQEKDVVIEVKQEKLVTKTVELNKTREELLVMCIISCTNIRRAECGFFEF